MSVTVKNLDEAISLFGDKIARAAMASTLNKVTRAVAPTLISQVVKQYNVKQSAVKKTLIFRKAKPKDLKSAIVSTGRRITLIGFRGTRQNKKGVVVTVKKPGKKLLEHRFIQTMKSGHKDVFERYGEKVLMGSDSSNKGQLKQRIRVLYGPAISQLIDEPAVIKKTVEDFGVRAVKEYDRQLRFRIQQTIRRAS